MLHTTRRTVLSGAAWTVPAVTLASAAPAFADSVVPDIAFTSGATKLVTDGDFFGVQFEDAFLTVAPDVLGLAAELTLTVVFVPTSGDDELFSDLTAPAGWIHQPRSATVRNLLVFARPTIPTSGALVPIEDGIYFGTDDVSQRGTFALTFRVGDLSTTWMVSTP
ncbi:hypothetical protein [Nocardioides gilvus]|uniref:hypothetical protein n=1 Tax=Nocardioides gilvus TaxID=1735589 RepID=UPI000D749879|nr:hypothetical protein [Nocardioides gilvus]